MCPLIVLLLTMGLWLKVQAQNLQTTLCRRSLGAASGRRKVGQVCNDQGGGNKCTASLVYGVNQQLRDMTCCTAGVVYISRIPPHLVRQLLPGLQAEYMQTP
jgi:hypothetical protein